MSKHSYAKYLQVSKNWLLKLSRSKNSFLRGPFKGVPRGVVPPNYVKIFVCSVTFVSNGRVSMRLTGSAEQPIELLSRLS